MLDNEKCKRIKKKRLSNFLLFYTFILFFVCFNMTVSRYASYSSADADISVAAWKIKINNNDFQTSNTFVLNNVQEVSGAQTANNKISPDSSGYFEIIFDLTNTEVAIEYKLEIDTSALKNNNINLELTGYSINDNEIKSITNNIIEGEINLNEINGNKVKFTENDNKVIKIYWNWQEDIQNPQFTKDNLKINVNAILKQKMEEG